MVKKLPSNPKYLVSDSGLVYGPRFGTDQPISSWVRTDHGWTGELVAIDGRPRHVHRLVLEAFVGPLPAGMHSRHINGNSLDNRLANLCYGTPSENVLDQVRHGTHHSARKTTCLRGHEFTHTAHGQRVCRECSRIRMQQHRARRGAAGVKPQTQTNPLTKLGSSA